MYFPYYGVPVNAHQAAGLTMAEDECLLELEYLLKEGLINSLLLELVQVTTGFVLSARFLKNLRSLFHQHNAKIVVDEVMTAGRTSRYLLYCTMCGFEADYITMGKWVMGALVLRRDTTVGPWDGPVASMARQGALQYGQVGSTVGDSIASSIAPMAANLRSIKRMIDAKGKQQLGKVVAMCRERFVAHLLGMFPGKDLYFWGVGGMVYCNVAANRPTQLRSCFLLLITPRDVQFDLTRVQGTSRFMGVPPCSPYVDDTLLQNAREAMHEGLSWCGRLMTPDLRLLHGSPEQKAAARKAQPPVVSAASGWVAGPCGGSFPPSRLSRRWWCLLHLQLLLLVLVVSGKYARAADARGWRSLQQRRQQQHWLQQQQQQQVKAAAQTHHLRWEQCRRLSLMLRLSPRRRPMM